MKRLKLTAFKAQHYLLVERIQNISESCYFWKLKKLDRDAISSSTRNSTTAKQIMCTFTPMTWK